MATCIALLRGINVGKAKRLAMADLRALVSELGYSNVKTLLNSGNVIFDAKRPNAKSIAAELEEAIEASAGFNVPVIVVTSTTLSTIIEGNSLRAKARDPSKLFVAFVSEAKQLTAAKTLSKEDWGREAIAVGTKAVYMWCPAGAIESKLSKAFARITKASATSRNWATVLKLQALTEAGGVG